MSPENIRLCEAVWGYLETMLRSRVDENLLHVTCRNCGGTGNMLRGFAIQLCFSEKGVYSPWMAYMD